MRSQRAYLHCRQIQQLVGHTDWVLSVAFLPDRQQGLTGRADTTARLWDAQTGQELHRLAGHTDAVVAAAFAPDGRRIATARRMARRARGIAVTRRRCAPYADGWCAI